MAIDTTEWLADQLVKSIRRRAFLPRADETYSDTDILEIADEQTREYLVPTLRAVDEEFLVRKYDFTLTPGQTDYRLPPRATAESVRGLLYDKDGNGTWVLVDRIDPTHTAVFERRQAPTGFYVEDDRIVFNPTPSSAQNVRLLIYQRPAKLVPVASAAKISSLVGDGVTFAVTSAPSWLTAGAAFDVVAGQPGWRTVVADNALTGGSTPPSSCVATTAFATGLVAAGDYVCQPGQSCFPQLPDVCHPLLAQRVAQKLLEGKNSAGYDLVTGELAATEARVRAALKPRTKGHPTYVHNFNAPGWRRR